MRIVITTTLNDNLFHAKLVPLLRSRPDVELVVVTDRSGPEYERVTWVWPRGLSKIFGRLGGRLLLLLAHVLHPKTRVVMAYNVVPHGLFASWCARVRGLPVYLHFIAGRAEIDFAADQQNLSDNRVIARSKNPKKLERSARNTALRAAKIFVPGQNTEEFVASLGYARENIVRLHSTIDPEKFYPGNSLRDFDVLISAQIRDRKRPLFTLDVCRKILDRRPETRFCWLGDGPDAEKFAQKIAALQLGRSLVWERHAKVEDYYRRGRVFLLCSISEGLSLACMEAMASGMVPVTSDCGDMADLVGERGAGELLAQSATVDDYAECVLRMLGDSARWTAESQQAIKVIQSEHSFSTAESEWRKILATLN